MQFLDAIEKSQILPKEVWVKQEELLLYLDPLASRLNVTLELVESLPAMKELRKHMTGFFQK